MFLAALLAIPNRPLLLAHVMPWFEKDGWHWKMNKPLPEGRVASHFQPIIGAYDSADRKVVELQVQLMKLSGFDGIIADWYGTHNWYDYPIIHKRTQLLFEVAEQAGLKVCVMYEDQTVRNAIKGNLAETTRSVEYATADGAWLKPWVSKPSWLTLKGKPVAFVFGPQFFEKPEWDAFLTAAGSPVLLSEHKQVPSAGGAFDWPIPSLGMKFTWEYPSRAASWGIKVASAFPRFKDFYDQGGGGKSHGELPDEGGKTYTETLSKAIDSGADAIQVVTWNDWGEGTQIEPSKEFGLRDLIATQVARRRIDPSFAFTKADLSAPLKLFEKRRAGDTERTRLASTRLLSGDVEGATKLLDRP
ncbi:MAG: hypothetical protein QE269_10065 [Fimbriimonas sp.]|nr:hypothetical protein [Fimbriimonas sp.]